MSYEGWAVFCDCDFIFLNDVSNLINNLDNEKQFIVFSMTIHLRKNIKWMAKNNQFILEKTGPVL